MGTVGGEPPDDFLAPARPLHDVRAAAHDGLNTLQVAATALATAESRFAFASLDAAVSYITNGLLPACRAEEATLFPAIDGLTGVRNTCHVMQEQHTTILRMAGDLIQAADAAKAAGDVAEYVRFLQPLLWGLYAFARAHLESEDEAYLGLLEAMLSDAQAEELAQRYVEALGPTRPEP